MNFRLAQAGKGETGLERACGKTNFELAPRQPLFVDGEADASFLEQRGAGVVPVPDANYIHLSEEEILEQRVAIAWRAPPQPNM